MGERTFCCLCQSDQTAEARTCAAFQVAVQMVVAASRVQIIMHPKGNVTIPQFPKCRATIKNGVMMASVKGAAVLHKHSSWLHFFQHIWIRTTQISVSMFSYVNLICIGTSQS